MINQNLASLKKTKERRWRRWWRWYNSSLPWVSCLLSW